MKKRSDKYWQNRAIDRLVEVERQSNGYWRKLSELHNQAAKQIEEDAQKIFESYMRSGGLKIEEAQQLLSVQQTQELRQELLQQLAKEANPKIRQQLLNILNAPAYAYRIARLQALQLKARMEIMKMAPKQVAILDECLRNTVAESFFHTMYDLQVGTGLAFGFAFITQEHIEELLRQSWKGDYFSNRVWKNTAAAAEKTSEIIKRNVMTGQSWRHFTRELNDFVNTPMAGAKYASERLLRTEVNHIHNEITARAHEQAGFERYRFMATLDNRTSETCQKHDGTIDPDTGEEYTYKNRKKGENYPPLHPFCRSTACGRFDAAVETKMVRTARDPITGQMRSVPFNLTYPEWVKTLTNEQRAMLKYWKEK